MRPSGSDDSARRIIFRIIAGSAAISGLVGILIVWVRQA